MQKNESNKINRKIEDKIINAAYGNAGLFDQLYVKWKVLTTPDLKKLFDEHRKISIVVSNLHQQDFPDRITDLVIRKTIGKKEKVSTTKLISGFVSGFLNNRLIPASVIGLILIILLSLFIFKEPVPSEKYSGTQIKLAQIQLEQALTIVGKAFNKAESSFTNEILDKQINKKFNRGYYLINNILIGG
jgi:hypothetical protein